ncbi:DUF3102 domain-containing protein [Caldilinea sp.]|uniref:DUF3102 domain-containing protein n=1 Tax=Caldilinea sp. TaxID=2293560 RepID=UPI0021DB85E5|nr:DUF3102 domain-containing protein [Caldilinea sp.]GIV73560.1 MAG: hypothetical protein KatS3mg049_2116 [Caldilinea sp.]
MFSGLINTRDEDAALRAGLRWDYSQLGQDAEEVICHAIGIKRNERKASEAIIEAGRHLLAVKARLSHGQWLDWLAVEFGMSDRTAQRMMAVAERFGGKSDNLSNLSASVLYLLAADSTPEEAREAVLEAAAERRVSVAEARQMVAKHRLSLPAEVWQLEAAVREFARSVADDPLAVLADVRLRWEAAKGFRRLQAGLPASYRKRDLKQALANVMEQLAQEQGRRGSTVEVVLGHGGGPPVPVSGGKASQEALELARLESALLALARRVAGPGLAVAVTLADGEPRWQVSVWAGEGARTLAEAWRQMTDGEEG